MSTVTPSHGIHPHDLAPLNKLLDRYGPELTLRTLAALCDDRMMQIAATDVSYAKFWLRLSTELETLADSIEK